MNTEKFALLQVNEESLKKFDLQVKDKRELQALINDSIYRVCARTSKEKFEVLDLRDDGFFEKKMYFDNKKI